VKGKNMIKLTQNEADMLIKMMKRKVEEQIIDFPKSQGKIIFDVLGERRTDEFVVNIERKGINARGCTYQGRVKSNNIILLRLDINPTSVHKNPENGEKIVGSHIHIYDEDMELKKAIPFDVGNKDLFELCFSFFEEFNIVEPPEIVQQLNIFDKEV
jgi:hypothetical protein